MVFNILKARIFPRREGVIVLELSGLKENFDSGIHFLKEMGLKVEPLSTAKDKKSNKSFPALEWLAAMCSHIPNRGEQMVRYYGFYSNVSRGERKKEGSDAAVPCILESQGMKRYSDEIGQGLFKRFTKLTPRSVLNVRAP